ncbi:unnamed protein product, partial [Iphiclides podalirius]
MPSPVYRKSRLGRAKHLIAYSVSRALCGGIFGIFANRPRPGPKEKRHFRNPNSQLRTSLRTFGQTEFTLLAELTGKRLSGRPSIIDARIQRYACTGQDKTRRPTCDEAQLK